VKQSLSHLSQSEQRAARLIWPIALWPDAERKAWQLACAGKGLDGLDNPAQAWRTRTVKKNEDGYGRYLAWLSRQGIFEENAPAATRITPDRIAAYTEELKAHLSSVSVAMTLGALTSAARALSPQTNFAWLTKRVSRLKLRAKPERDKRHAVQHTLDLYLFGKDVMDNADTGYGRALAAAQRYQTGLMIALLAARPLRIRNFQDIVIGRSLRWDGRHYWLTFNSDQTKTGAIIDEPFPSDLVPYLEIFLRVRRPLIVAQARKASGNGGHRSLWVNRYGLPMNEPALRDLIKTYTRRRFGTAVWPHLFRHCLLTSVATDQPDLMKVSASLLGHTNHVTGEKHYNQAHMIDAGRRFTATVLELREAMWSSHRNESE
jgi:integrase/recombinase XerD